MFRPPSALVAHFQLFGDAEAGAVRLLGRLGHGTPDSRSHRVAGGRMTVGADRGCDKRDFVWDCRDMHITPHVAQRRHSAIDGRTTRHSGYRLSQRVRKRVEEVLGWVKTVGGGRKLRYRGVDRNQMWAELTVVGYNLVRLARLAQSPA